MKLSKQFKSCIYICGTNLLFLWKKKVKSPIWIGDTITYFKKWYPSFKYWISLIPGTSKDGECLWKLFRNPSMPEGVQAQTRKLLFFFLPWHVNLTLEGKDLCVGRCRSLHDGEHFWDTTLKCFHAWGSYGPLSVTLILGERPECFTLQIVSWCWTFVPSCSIRK